MPYVVQYILVAYFILFFFFFCEKQHLGPFFNVRKDLRGDFWHVES